ncbi:uncharacterized protein CANTADRAFT_33233, partial [Suhomyces tanzawaensis NRRL Y-17324]
EKVLGHYKLRDELAELQRQNDRRKHLVMLGIQKVVLLSQAPKKTAKGTNEATRLKTQVNDYELYTNKLKQEHSTKIKLQEAKLEALREENSKLKSQIKSLKDSVIYNRGPGNILSSRTIPSPFTLPKFSFKHDELNPLGIAKPILKLDKILTPVAPRVKKPKRTYITSKNINQFDLLMNPGSTLNKSEDILADLLKTKDSSTEPPVLESTSVKTSVPPSSSEGNTTKSTPLKTPSRQSFIENFDKSSDSNSASPEFTPSRAKPQVGSLKRITSSAAVSEHKMTLFSVTEEDTFTSANSTMLGMKSDDETTKRRKKKLQLWKSNATKIDLAADKKSKSFGLEDENLNSLNYYQDENFALNDGDSPLKSTKKRAAEDDPLPRENVKKKKRNIFKID